MNATALDNLGSSAALQATTLSRRLPVAVQAADDSGTFDAKLKNAAEAMQAARQLVATAFINPMLAQMRDEPFRTEMFHGGFAEDAFGQQLDTLLADRITSKMSGGDPVNGQLPRSGSGLSLVDAVYRRLMRQPQVQVGDGRFDVHG